MDTQIETIRAFLKTVHPYDSLPRDELAHVATSFRRSEIAAGQGIYQYGEPLSVLYLVQSGRVEITDRGGMQVSQLGAKYSFGERGLLRDGTAATNATALEDCVLLALPVAELRRLIETYPAFERFFPRAAPAAGARRPDLSTQKVADLMATAPVNVGPDTTVQDAAKLMHDKRISSLVITQGAQLLGIVTTRDLTGRVLAQGLPGDTPVRAVMTADPLALGPDDLVSDLLQLMLERRIAHIPVVQDGELRGIVTQTDLTRFQATSSSLMVRDIAGCNSAADMAEVTARIPELLRQLVAAHSAHEVVTRLITDIADTVTRRLLALAEQKFGPPPVPYVWAACGSQGRQEQTGVSDQDNCLILDDAVTPGDMPYFHNLAKYVSDGLDVTGYFYCPGDMMATAPRWCQPAHVWRDYFSGWIASPDGEAQMLASVMFDLRAIGGTASLLHDLQTETLSLAAKNSIFVAFMIANSLKHQPPLGLLRGISTIRSGPHKHHIDMKHTGVVPITDMARVYALRGELTEVNTRARLLAAEDAGVISVSGARDLIEAYDLIANLRLENQATLVKMGRKPDNFLAPADLSAFERNHLRDAFVVVRTMQSALSQRAGALG